MCCRAAQSLALAAPGVGLLRVQQAGGVSVCPPVWPGTWVSFQGVSSEDRSFSDAGFQVLRDLEPSGTISRGVFRKCSAPDSVGRKVQQNAAFSQKEPPSVGREAECVRADGVPFVTRHQHLTRQGELRCPDGLPAATRHRRAVLGAALRAP